MQPNTTQNYRLHKSYCSINIHQNKESQTVLDIEDQTRIEIVINEQNTVWHHLFKYIFNEQNAKQFANNILQIVQSKCALIIGIISIILYMIGLYIFDRGLFSQFSTIYSIIILTVALPESILYFGTLNVPICLSILKNGTFWFKIYNVLLCNIMSVIWAHHNLSFNVISRYQWFTIYSLYFFVNFNTTSMGCLLDGLKWSRWLKILVPLFFAIYFARSTIYWHYLQCDTMLNFQLFGYKKDFLLTNVASNAAFNAAIFFFGQSFHTFWYHDRTSILSAKATLIWMKPE